MAKKNKFSYDDHDQDYDYPEEESWNYKRTDRKRDDWKKQNVRKARRDKRASKDMFFDS